MYNIKCQEIIKESKSRYLSTTAFTKLLNQTHGGLKRDVRNTWIKTQ